MYMGSMCIIIAPTLRGSYTYVYSHYTHAYIYPCDKHSLFDFIFILKLHLLCIVHNIFYFNIFF